MHFVVYRLQETSNRIDITTLGSNVEQKMVVGTNTNPKPSIRLAAAYQHSGEEGAFQEEEDASLQDTQVPAVRPERATTSCGTIPRQHLLSLVPPLSVVGC